jgi:hypothetical protein
LLSLRQISDRLAIQQNVRDYAREVDTRDWTLYRKVFLPTAKDLYHIPDQTLDEAIAWLQEVMPNPPIIGYQHLLGGLWINVTGDEGESVAHCFDPQNYLQPDRVTASLHLQFFHYHWRHVRTAEAWRIAGRWNGPGALPGRVPERNFSRWAAPPVGLADSILDPVASPGLLPVGKIDEESKGRCGK